MSTTSQLVSEFSQMKDFFDFSVLESLDPDDFIGFGLQTSHEYRKQFKKMCADASLSKKAITLVILLTLLVKKKERIVKASATDKFMSSFSADADMMAAVAFISAFTEQSTKHPDVIAMKKFPLVNIPSCQPNLSLFIFLMFNMKDASFVAKTAEQRMDFVFEGKNTFMVQMNLDPALQEMAKAGNVKFWSDTVKKSTVEKGKFFEAGWHEDYYDTAAKDMYPILEKSATSFAAKGDIITKDRFLKYVMTMKIS